ncbi:MAG: GNAT family N-acetyltransferase [Bacteroidetes bacterium]|nr:GNAT family N-acetyltransferase [Bacteroidota bacterium]
MGKAKVAKELVEQVAKAAKSKAAKAAGTKANKLPKKLYTLDELEKAGIEIPVEHLGEDDAEVLGKAWSEEGYNYRLNYLPEKKYFVKDGEVVGHIGLDDNGSIKASYINSDRQGRGLGTEMYETLLNEGYPVSSDELMAMEPEAKAIWEKLRAKRPDLISKTKKGYQFDPDAGPKKAKLPSPEAPAAIARDPAPNKNLRAEAQKILARISTPEQAVALKGAERQQYLEALDAVYGPQAERARSMGFGDEDYYHGSFRDIKQFKPEKGNPEGFAGKSIYLTNDPVDASYNYAHKEGPDVKNKWKQLTERLRGEKDLDYSTAKDLAEKKLFGRVDDGAVYPVKVRVENTADMRPDSKQRLDLSSTIDDGDLVSENPIAEKIVNGIRDRAKAAKYQVRSDAIVDASELYDEKRPAEIFNSVKNAVQQEEVSDNAGNFLSSEFARGAMEDAGYDSMRINADYEFNMPNTTPNTEHLMLFDPAKVRSKFAAFDPRFKDSPLLMSAVGGAPKAGDVLKGISPLGAAKRAYNAYDEAVQQPVSNIAQAIAAKIAQATTLPGTDARTAQQYQDTATGLLGTGLEMSLDPTNIVAPGAGVMRAVGKSAKAAKGANAVNKVLDVLKGPRISKAAHEAQKAANPISIITSTPPLQTATKKLEQFFTPQEIHEAFSSKPAMQKLLDRVKDASKKPAPAPSAPTPLKPAEAVEALVQQPAVPGQKVP